MKTIEEFAIAAGVEICECGKEWGGTIAYMEKDSPNSRTCGFRSRNAAYNHWLDSTFGKSVSIAIRKLLRQSK